MDQYETGHAGRPRPDHIVLDGDSAPVPQKGGGAPNFRFIPVVAKWLDGSRCHLVGGRPQTSRHCVKWGPSSPRQKEAEPPIFGPCLLWPDGWMDQDATWYGGRPQPRRHYVRLGPSSHSHESGRSPPIFGPCLMWPNGRMDEDIIF